ncbi:MAG: LamG domain-containing protein, partial [Elusimicrobia bacterium]
PVTSDMVSLWIPSGTGRAIDIIRGNHGQCYGTHPNVPVISPPIDQISACDATTYWQGESLSIDEADKKEGSGSLEDTVASPTINSLYATVYNPTGSWDWSAKKHILFWLKSDRASTAFANVWLMIYDTSGNYRYWDLTFSAGAWTAQKLLLLAGDGESGTPPDLVLTSYIAVRFKAADETPFYKKIDDVRVTGKPSLLNPSVGWSFDGTDDYIDLGTEVGDYTDNFTLGAWVKSLEVNSRIISRRTIALGQYDFHIQAPAGFLMFYCDAGERTGTTNIDDDKWHFCVASINGSNSQLYLDAVVDGAIFNPTITNRDVKFLIGAFDNGTDGLMDGNIALPFVANKAWSVAQVKNFWLATKGLFAPRG